jgi:hypothetical protein
MLEIDYNKASDFGGIKDGTYEVKLNGPRIDATPAGTEHLNIRMQIRDDVQQHHQGQYIFHKIWMRKKTGKYDDGDLIYLARQAGIEEGTVFKSIDDYLEMLDGRVLRVYVKNETSTYNQKNYNNLNVKRMMETVHPLTKPFNQFIEPIEFDEKDLPF